MAPVAMALLLATVGCSHTEQRHAIFTEPGAAKYIREVGSAYELEGIIQTEGLVFVDFYMDGCGPCRLMAPTIVDLSNRHEGEMAFVCVNVTNKPEYHDRYDVPKAPDLRVYRDGKLVVRWQGFQDRDRLTESIAHIVAGRDHQVVNHGGGDGPVRHRRGASINASLLDSLPPMCRIGDANCPSGR